MRGRDGGVRARAHRDEGSGALVRTTELPQDGDEIVRIRCKVRSVEGGVLGFRIDSCAGRVSRAILFFFFFFFFDPLAPGVVLSPCWSVGERSEGEAARWLVGATLPTWDP